MTHRFLQTFATSASGRSASFWRVPVAVLMMATLSAVVALAQGGACVDNLGGPASTVLGGYLAPLPGAQIQVCTYPAVGNRCTNPATIYATSALASVLPNPITADAGGNFHFCMPFSSHIALQVTGANAAYVLPDVTLMGPGTPGAPGANGLNGTGDATVLAGPGPLPGTAAIGDYYFNTATGCFWGPKATFWPGSPDYCTIPSYAESSAYAYAAHTEYDVWSALNPFWLTAMMGGTVVANITGGAVSGATAWYVPNTAQLAQGMTVLITGEPGCLNNARATIFSVGVNSFLANVPGCSLTPTAGGIATSVSVGGTLGAFDTVCVSGDCRNAWPTGGSGGGSPAGSTGDLQTNGGGGAFGSVPQSHFGSLAGNNNWSGENVFYPDSSGNFLYFTGGTADPPNTLGTAGRFGYRTDLGRVRQYVTSDGLWHSLAFTDDPMRSVRTGTIVNTDLTGRLALASGAATYSLTGAYASPPDCICKDVTVPANECIVTESTVTLSFAGIGTDSVKYICVGRN